MKKIAIISLLFITGLSVLIISSLGIDFFLPENTIQVNCSIGETWTESHTDMKFKCVPGGTFKMGNDTDSQDEKPIHTVTLGGFWMAQYEITQSQWQKILANKPAEKKGNNHPVENISWHDIQSFIEKLNQRGDDTFRLPTEAEWEYACRNGGKQTYYCGGDRLDDYGWTNGTDDEGHFVVGGKLSNSLELYDMTGSVWEWVQDWYDVNYYSRSQKKNPQGSFYGKQKVIRGCAFNSIPSDCRATARLHAPPDMNNFSVGARLVRLPSASIIKSH